MATKQKIVRNPLQKRGMYSGESAWRSVGGPDGLLANMRPFKGYSMSADCFMPGLFEGPGGLGSGLGWLPTYLCTKIFVASPIYVVYSRATPIAWVDDEGSVTVPTKHYSLTTTQQQNMCRSWLKADHGTMLAVYKKIDEDVWA